MSSKNAPADVQNLASTRPQPARIPALFNDIELPKMPHTIIISAQVTQNPCSIMFFPGSIMQQLSLHGPDFRASSNMFWQGRGRRLKISRPFDHKQPASLNLMDRIAWPLTFETSRTATCSSSLQDDHEVWKLYHPTSRAPAKDIQNLHRAHMTLLSAHALDIAMGPARSAGCKL